MRSYDPETGKLLWQIEGAGRTASTPVSDEERLYFDSYDRLTGSNGVVIAIRPGAEGKISLDPDDPSEHVAWTKRMGGFRIASPVVCKECLYLPEQSGGILRCVDATTGEEHYRKRLPDASGFSASPIAHREHVYFVDQRGHTAVIEADSKLNVIASNDLDEMTWASPAVAGDRLLVRTVDHLYCIGK
jgi:outer membrane protein assembly factor BamB